MEIERFRMEEVYPAEYLRNGFIGSDGELLEGLSSYYSLAMAYRLQSEGTSSARVQQLADELTNLLSTALANAEAIEDQPLHEDTATALRNIFQTSTFRESVCLSVLLDAAEPQIVSWRSLAGFIVHLERIASQLALLIV
jgi:hypothetical protein